MGAYVLTEAVEGRKLTSLVHYSTDSPKTRATAAFGRV